MRVRERPEFAEIPDAVKARLDRELRRQAFDLLHAEAVRRGDIGAAPATYFDGIAGRILALLFALAFGLMLGSLAVALFLYTARTLATVL